MIKELLELLASKDWMIKDEDIQIAKGAYELPSTIREIRTKRTRKKLINGIR